MPPKKLRLDHGEGTSSGGGRGGGGGGDAGDAADEDRLSALPDALLHHVMSFLRAWEVARTCVLSRRWRHLWASAPCVDLRVRRYWIAGGHLPPPNRLANFVYRFFLEREVTAPVDTLRLLSRPNDLDLNYPAECYDERSYYSIDDVCRWISAAIKLRARLIQIAIHHPRRVAFAQFDPVPIISSHLKHLQLSGCSLGKRTLMLLSSQELCPSLEGLDLEDCLLEAFEMRSASRKSLILSSASLKSLIMDDCRIIADLTIAAPNLESLRCIMPSGHRAEIFENMWSLTLATATIVLDDSFWYAGSNGDEILGGLSNARSLELLADAGKVILNWEQKTCPIFGNLKTLSLGEWCMGADFNPLVSFLQHSPNLERLFLELKLKIKDHDRIQATKDDAGPKGGSFACKHLKMVEIKCFMDDTRVHFLAQLFNANGIPMENISVLQIRRPISCTSFRDSHLL